MKRCRLLLADDHDILIEGLRRVLDRADLEIVGVVNDGRALVDAAEELQPDLIISDLTMPVLNGIEAMRQIRKTNTRVKIIFLTMHADLALATEALAAGGSGYVLKSRAGKELLTAVREVMKGLVYVTSSIAEAVRSGLSSPNASRSPNDRLTSRQREVLQLLAEGMHVKAIAGKLRVSPRTVEFHKYRIMEELGLHSVVELGSYAAKHKIVA
jgi:DNA-binding NarL/FixJ family response regulator